MYHFTKKMKIYNEKYKNITDYIYGLISIPNHYFKFIDTIYVQRLRNILQIPTAKYVFPSVTHSCYEHAIGTYFLSNKYITDLKTRQKELDINQEIVSYFPEKGISIEYRADYFFKEYANVESIQTVVFDSPLVSVRGKKETEGGTANTFVGITLYDKEGKEIVKKDLNIEKLRPKIYYKEKLFKAMKHCLYYNEKDDKIENSGIDTETIKIKGEDFIKCVPNHLTAFTIGSYKSASISDSSSNVGTIILVIFLCLIVIALVVGGYLFWKKRTHADSSQFNQAFPNKDGLMS